MRLILVGIGNVGQSLIKLLLANRERLIASHGLNPKVVCIIDSKSQIIDEKGVNLEYVLKRKASTGLVGEIRNAPTEEIITEVEAEVVIETTPTNHKSGEPALTHIVKAFTSKKSVITTNKGPLAIAFSALNELARHNGVFFKFSGTVGAGTPILDFGMACAKGDSIKSIEGILNSTSNYILTMMERDRLTFKQALATAKREGYAESDPTLDIMGYDTAMKLVILSNCLLNRKVTLRDVKIHGIENISLEEINEAKKRNKSVRLIARADDELTVAPMLINSYDPLCVSGPYNALRFVCENSGEKILIGKGAGGIETAASIIRDLIDIREKIRGSEV